MKYKVMFNLTTGSGNRAMGNAEFYIYDEAVAACQGWRELSSGHVAILWDGISWTTYSPNP